jgi:hypothetical protein
MLPVQARGITMKSSSICLLHVPGAAALPGGANACPDADKLAKGVLITSGMHHAAQHSTVLLLQQS